VASFHSSRLCFCRISCQSLNPFLESDPAQCLSVPGCYFDFELFIYREVLGQAALPGVPVCYFAIKNKAFHEQVNIYIEQVRMQRSRIKKLKLKLVATWQICI